MTPLPEYPYETVSADHCETAPEAYADAALALDLIAGELGKTRETLDIYDPYYCNGAAKKHLHQLGFTSVYNACEDFYRIIEEKRVPGHDVVVTNPPYSGDHVQKLLRFCRQNGKPFLLLMPNYVSAKEYFMDAIRDEPLYLVPRKRYHYWTPKGLRSKEESQSHASALGHRTSPFISLWYIDLRPVLPRYRLLTKWRQQTTQNGKRSVDLCPTRHELPSAVRP